MSGNLSYAPRIYILCSDDEIVERPLKISDCKLIVIKNRHAHTHTQSMVKKTFLKEFFKKED